MSGANTDSKLYAVSTVPGTRIPYRRTADTERLAEPAVHDLLVVLSLFDSVFGNNSDQYENDAMDDPDSQGRSSLRFT